MGIFVLFQNFSDNEITISFAINGVSQGTAVTIPREGLPEGFSLFPHVLAKNYAFEVNLGAKEEAFFANPEDFKDYVYVDKVEDMIAGPMRPEKRGDCEVCTFYFLFNFIMIQGTEVDRHFNKVFYV